MLATKLAPCRAWHAAAHNPQRDGGPLRAETIDKHVARLTTFATFFNGGLVVAPAAREDPPEQQRVVVLHRDPRRRPAVPRVDRIGPEAELRPCARAGRRTGES